MGNRSYLIAYNSDKNLKTIDDPNYSIPDYFIFLFAKEKFKLVNNYSIQIPSTVAIKKITLFLTKYKTLTNRDLLIKYFTSTFSKYKYVLLNIIELITIAYDNDDEILNEHNLVLDDLSNMDYNSFMNKWKRVFEFINTDDKYFSHFNIDIKQMSENSHDSVLNLINLLKLK